LRARRSAIDFIGQEDVGENRPFVKENVWSRWLKTDTPRMSEGSKSGVN
jgi:hypothetical protein